MIKFFLNISLLVLLIITFISCGRREFTEAGINETVEEINVLLESAKGKKFDWGNQFAFSNYRAYLNNKEIIFINEDLQHRYPKEEFNRFYFKDENLIYFLGKWYEPETKIKSDLTVYFDPNGNVIRYDYFVANKRINLNTEVSDYILNHANELFDITKQKIASSE